GWRWQRKRFAAPLGSREAAGQQADRRGFDITLAAGDLAGETQARRCSEPQGFVQQLRRVEKRVAVNPAKPRELGLLQSRNGAEDAHLLGMLELGLEADHVEQGPELVVLAQLHDRI